MAKIFVPYKECSVASGACFEDGKCLRRCQPTLTAAQANSELATALRLLKDMREYVVNMRSLTRYVDDSNIDKATKEAQDLIKKHKL